MAGNPNATHGAAYKITGTRTQDATTHHQHTKVSDMSLADARAAGQPFMDDPVIQSSGTLGRETEHYGDPGVATPGWFDPDAADRGREGSRLYGGDY